MSYNMKSKISNLKKLKTKEEILAWFGSEDKDLKDVVAITDNRVFRKLEREGLFEFEDWDIGLPTDRRVYRVKK